MSEGSTMQQISPLGTEEPFEDEEEDYNSLSDTGILQHQYLVRLQFDWH